MVNVINIARREAGYRELYAIKHGNKQVIFINGHKCYKWTYSTAIQYQDANGATFDTVTLKWIN